MKYPKIKLKRSNILYGLKVSFRLITKYIKELE